jgi:hypothetical protein
MLSESTARLVEHIVKVSEPELVRIKGFDEPLSARRLLAIQPRHALVRGTESRLVGRREEMAALDAMVDRAVGGRGGVVGVVGAPGIGKSRMAREAAALAAGRGVELVWTFCESHASDIPFHAVRRLLRAVGGIEDLDGPAARTRVRERLPNADPQDLLLLDDLLSVADPDVALPQIDPIRAAPSVRLPDVSPRAGLEIRHGVLRADDSALRAIEEAAQTAQRAGNDYALHLAEYSLGMALLNLDAAADRQRGLELVNQVLDKQREQAPYMVPLTEMLAGPEMARSGNRNAAIRLMRKAVDQILRTGRFAYGVFGTAGLVETLLERGAEDDLTEAEEAIDRLANLPADDGWAIREITLLRLRALLARARADETAYRDYRDRYRTMAKSLKFDGHIAWADAMS